MNEAKLKTEGNMSKKERKYSTKGSKRKHSHRMKKLVARGMRRCHKLLCRQVES